LARAYANENVPLPSVLKLRELGHEVLTSSDCGHANLRFSDEHVLSFAFDNGLIVLTNNRRDFRRLHAMGAKHSGIVEFTNDGDFAALASRISAALQAEPAVGRFYASVTKNGHTFR
jgi:hypothetical protein